MRKLLTILFLLPFALAAQRGAEPIKPIIDTFRVAYVKQLSATTHEIRLKYHGEIIRNFIATGPAGMQAGDSVYILRPNNTTRFIQLTHKGKQYIIKPK